MNFLKFGIVLLTAALSASAVGAPDPLRIGVAGYAFDHNGAISNQADAAIASGFNIIYCGGIGGFGYSGLPEEKALATSDQQTLAYTTQSKTNGIHLAIAYICATSIVGLDRFDKHWTPKNFARVFKLPRAMAATG